MTRISMRGSWHFLATAIIVAFGTSFQSGYFLSLYNIPQDIVEQFINASAFKEWNRTLGPVQLSTIWATIATSNQIGRFLGALLTSLFVDRIGRKWSIISSSSFCVFGALALYLAQPTGEFALLACGRLIIGIYNGATTIVVQLFLVEIAITPNRRGSITRVHNIFSLLGTTGAFFVSLPELLGDENRWKYLPLISMPQLIFAVTWLLAVPDTPMYMLQRGKEESEVRRSLKYYLGDSADNFRLENDKQKGNKKDWWPMISDSFENPAQRKLLVLWSVLGLAASFNGSGVVNNYLTSMISRRSTFTTFDRYASVIMNAFSILAFFTAIYLINKFGRRPLLLANFWIVAACITILAILAFADKNLDPDKAKWTRVSILFIWSSLQYITNSVSMLVTAETASQHMRALSLGITTTTYHVTTILITLLFPIIFKLSEGGSYLFLAIPSLFIGVYLQVTCPETKAILFLQEECSETTPCQRSA